MIDGFLNSVAGALFDPAVLVVALALGALAPGWRVFWCLVPLAGLALHTLTAFLAKAVLTSGGYEEIGLWEIFANGILGKMAAFMVLALLAQLLRDALSPKQS